MEIIAHRGFAEDNIENTLQSFKDSKNKCDYIELDVRSSSDNVPVIFHDKNIKRICNKNKKISDLTVKDLKKYNILDTSEKIPTLKSVLEKINSPLLVEIKDKNIVDEIHTLCKKYNNKIIYQSFNPNIINEIPNSEHKLLLCTPEKYLNKEGIPKNAITNLEGGIKLCPKINGLSIHHSMIDYLEDVPDEYSIYVWTIRSKNRFNNIKHNTNIDGVITDSLQYVQ